MADSKEGRKEESQREHDRTQQRNFNRLGKRG